MSAWTGANDDLPINKKVYQLYCSDTGEQFAGFHHHDGKFQFGRYRDSVTDALLLCAPTHWTELKEQPK